jgi:hypothetical protein
MKTISIAFDTDGVLRCNCTDVCRDANLRMVELFNILQDFENVELYVWSGAGKTMPPNLPSYIGSTCRNATA